MQFSVEFYHFESSASIIKFADDIEKVIQKDVRGIVVGYPLLENGKPSKLCEEIHQIIFQLQNIMNVRQSTVVYSLPILL